MPYFRHRSFVFAPASASLSTPMICSSVNRRLFIRLLPMSRLYFIPGLIWGSRPDQPGFPRKASLPNLLSALNAFLNDLGLDPSHAVGTTLRVGYYKAVEGHIS